MPKLCRNNVSLPCFQFHFKDKLLENATQKRPSKTCSVSISQYFADGSSGTVILALYHCHMTSSLDLYLPAYGCLGFAFIESFLNFDFFGQTSLYFLLRIDWFFGLNIKSSFSDKLGVIWFIRFKIHWLTFSIDFLYPYGSTLLLNHSHKKRIVWKHGPS